MVIAIAQLTKTGTDCYENDNWSVSKFDGLWAVTDKSKNEIVLVTKYVREAYYYVRDQQAQQDQQSNSNEAQTEQAAEGVITGRIWEDGTETYYDETGNQIESVPADRTIRRGSIFDR